MPTEYIKYNHFNERSDEEEAEDEARDDEANRQRFHRFDKLVVEVCDAMQNGEEARITHLISYVEPEEVLRVTAAAQLVFASRTWRRANVGL